MKIVTKTAWKDVPKLYATDGNGDPMDKTAFVKVFGPGRYTYYVCEWDGEDTVFGYCVSPLGPDCDEWGYASISEWESVGPFPIERDAWFEPQTVGEALTKLGVSMGGAV
jgi:hypothetical protein